MKIIENIIENVIVKKLEAVDFKELIKNYIEKHKGEIKEALKDLIKAALCPLTEKEEK